MMSENIMFSHGSEDDIATLPVESQPQAVGSAGLPDVACPFDLLDAKGRISQVAFHPKEGLVNSFPRCWV